MTTAETQTWRVVCEGGEVREVTARRTPGSYGGEWRADSGVADPAGGSSARKAVLILVAEAHWPVVEIVAPGAQTSEERLAEAIAERDAAVAQRDALAAAVRGLFAAQAAVSMPVAANDLPALLLDFVAGVPADEGIVAAGRALTDACTALDAALAAAGGV